MIITLLALLFLVFLLAVIYLGKGILLKAPSNPDDVFKEKCSLCREKFHKSELIIREIGDFKLFYFCRGCIERLANEVKQVEERTKT